MKVCLKDWLKLRSYKTKKFWKSIHEIRIVKWSNLVSYCIVILYYLCIVCSVSYCIVLYCIVLPMYCLYCIVLYCIVLDWIGLDLELMYIAWTGLAYSRTACFAQRLISDWTVSLMMKMSGHYCFPWRFSQNNIHVAYVGYVIYGNMIHVVYCIML